MLEKRIMKVKINDAFWSPYRRLVREVVLPYQWEALNDNVEGAELSHAVKNMKIAAGIEKGEFKGFVFQDTDLMKWIEAVSYSLVDSPDEQQESRVDELVGYMEKAQRQDGYLDSYYIINGLDKRFTNLRDCHELYCLGHMIEAAVAYHDATGKRKFIDIASRFADLAFETFGAEEGKLKGYPGHEVAEFALVKLYKATGNSNYLKLSEYFINQRGTEPNYFVEEWEKRERTGHWSSGQSKNVGDLKYWQAHKPVRQQTEAVGHAVRAVYLYAGMAAVAAETGDKSLVDACRILWDNMTQKQIYITGGIGQTHHGEAFTFDYDLPNDTVYSETCAAIGLVFFAYEMLQIEPDGKYADVLEQALYNTVLAGMSSDGKRFFYVNPTESWPEASEKNPGRRHVKAERQPWFGCSCCPPNLARLVAGLGKYIYMQNNNGDIYVNLFIGSSADFGYVEINQKTKFPNNGITEISFAMPSEKSFTVYIRIPKWCTATPKININSIAVDSLTVENGYLPISRNWADGDIITVEFPMTARFIRSNKNVRANAGKAAVMRGPVVYCAEQADNGANISALRFLAKNEIKECFDGAVFCNTIVLKTNGRRDEDDNDELYFPVSDKYEDTEITLVPYAKWGNRGVGEMAVWLPVIFEK